MKKQQGFTLIELIMVIVILGILAAFAIPKFANLGADARRSTMQGVEGAMKSASAISHAAWLASGTNPASVTLEGASVAMVNGYPSAAGIVVAANITGGAAATDAGDFIVSSTATATTVQAKGATTPASCQVVYTQSAAANTAPVITSTLTNCN
jgi:MSHA pilin protein MshA